MRTPEEINDGRTPPARIDLKVGEWLDRRYYVADVSGGWATVLVQSIDHTREEIEELGARLRAERRKQHVVKRSQQRRHRS